MQPEAKSTVRGERVPIHEIHERGKRLRMRVVVAGFPQYATAITRWSPALLKITNVHDRIRQIGLGRGHGYDLELLVELEKVVSRRLAKHSNA